MLVCAAGLADLPAAPTTTAPASAASQPADADLRHELVALRARLEALEVKHAEEHENDQRRIAELEARIAGLQSPSIEAARLEALRQQIAEIRREMAREAGLTPASRPAQTAGAEGELKTLAALWPHAQTNFVGEAWESSWADWTARRQAAERVLSQTVQPAASPRGRH